MKDEDINSCVSALIQLSGHSPKTASLSLSLPIQYRWVPGGTKVWVSGSRCCHNYVCNISSVFSPQRYSYKDKDKDKDLFIGR